MHNRKEGKMRTPLLTKEEFCKIINQIQEQRKKNSDFSDALYKMCDGHPVFDTNNQYLDALLFVLNKEFGLVPNEEGNTLEWYLFEGNRNGKNEHITSFEGYTVNINTPELLYDELLTDKAFSEDGDIEPTREFFKKYGTKEVEEC